MSHKTSLQCWYHGGSSGVKNFVETGSFFNPSQSRAFQNPCRYMPLCICRARSIKNKFKVERVKRQVAWPYLLDVRRLNAIPVDATAAYNILVQSPGDSVRSGMRVCVLALHNFGKLPFSYLASFWLRKWGQKSRQNSLLPPSILNLFFILLDMM